jgi:hypothetical protein
MSQRGSVIFRVFAAVILLAVMAGGVFMAFQAGQAQGYALGASTGVADRAGIAVQQLPPTAFYPGMMGHHFFHPFMGFFAIIPFLFGLCLFFGLIRMVVWGPRRHHCGPWMHGPYAHGPWNAENGENPWHGWHPYGEPGTSQPKEQEEKK